MHAWTRVARLLIPLGLTLTLALGFGAPVWAANPHDLPNGTEVIAWGANDTGITMDYSTASGNYAFSETNPATTLDAIAPLLAYYHNDPSGAATMFPSGIGLTISPDAEAVMTIYNFNPDAIGGADIPPLTTLSAAQISWLQTVGYSAQLATWEAQHSTPPPTSSAPPSSPAPKSSSPASSSPASKSSPPATPSPAPKTPAPSSHAPASQRSTPVTRAPSSRAATASRPVIPPVTPRLARHPVSRFAPGTMPRSEQPAAPATRPPFHPTPPSWLWWAGGGAVGLAAAFRLIMRLF